jgi:anthranilate/para-aminobenzoate synthase component II
MGHYDSFEYKLTEAAKKLGQELDKAKAELERLAAESKK